MDVPRAALWRTGARRRACGTRTRCVAARAGPPTLRCSRAPVPGSGGGTPCILRCRAAATSPPRARRSRDARRATRDALTAACLCVARVRCCACRRVCARALRRLRCCVPPARGSLWNAAHDDTIPDPVAKKASFTGLHNAGWLWNTGDHTTGASVHDITGQDTHVPFH